MRSDFFRGKNILLISPERWDHLFVSKHHYAIELARHNHVFFLNPPSTELSLAKSGYKNLMVVSYTHFIFGLRFLPTVLQLYFMRKKYNAIEKIASIQFDCVWSFDNSVFFDFSFLPKKILKISHLVDYSQNFQLSKAASSADICFGVSQNIVDRLLMFNKNSFLIPHGISVNNFEEKEVQLPGSNLIKAIYAGNLDSKYIDRHLLSSIIDNHTQVDFIFLGSGGSDWIRQENTFFLGFIKHDHLMSYLKKADILLLVYDVEKHPDQLTNAHKILEYLASGNVIVSSFIKDYVNRPDLLEMAIEREDFAKLFGKVMLNLSLFNNGKNKVARMNYANTNTYSKRLIEIEKLVIEVTSSKLN